MNPISTELLLGFDNEDLRTISATKGDTERKVHCVLHDSFVSYMIEGTTYVFLKGIFSNGELIPPIRIWPNADYMTHETELSDDKSELDFYLPVEALQISGIAKYTLSSFLKTYMF